MVVGSVWEQVQIAVNRHSVTLGLCVKCNVLLKLITCLYLLIAVISNYLTNTGLCSAYSVRCRNVQKCYSFRKQTQNCLSLQTEEYLVPPGIMLS